MSDYDELQQEAAYEEYRDELIRDAIKDISTEGISAYLIYYGDAIESRILHCLKTSSDLHTMKYYGASVVSSCTSIEITIRYFLLTPLLQGMFLSDEWAETLTNRIISGQPTKDRNIVPSILNSWKIDINNVRLSSGEPLWNCINDKLWKARNLHVHRGDPVPENISATAIESATLLLNLTEEVVQKSSRHSKQNGMWGSTSYQKNPF